VTDDLGATATADATEPARILHTMLNALEELDPEQAANCFAEDGTIVRVREGQISHLREFFNPLAWLESLGWAPVPPPGNADR
jgi:hypothetical protein